jgi:catechol 2,3-dioxygenase-like lactoylglutathione lyase family enzyme
MSLPQTNFKPPFNITRASHLVLTAQDLAASKAFYTEVVGLALAHEDANTLWLRGVEERQHHSLTLKKTTGEPSCEAVGMHVFDEEDLDKAKSYFDTSGIASKFIEAPFQGRTLRFSDNMGTVVDLVATMDQQPRNHVAVHTHKGATGISMIKPAVPSWFSGNQDTFLYTLCLFGFALSALFVWRLTRGDTGRSLRAVRDSGLIAESLGVNLTKVRLAAFVTCSGMAGFAGGLFAIVNGFVSPESFQMTKSFDFLVGSIVGGITSISGSLIGALLIVFLPDWAADMNIALSGLIYGAVLVVMMLVARDGVMGLLSNLLNALRTRIIATTADDRLSGRRIQI